jgi:3-isopropylmalate/(R)-2-methylmalate dehydratase large subunit
MTWPLHACSKEFMVQPRVIPWDETGMAKGLYEKLWDEHIVASYDDGSALLYIDRHLVQEVSSPQAFASLAKAGRGVRRPSAHLAVADHAVPTRNRGGFIADPLARNQIQRLEENVARFGLPYIPLTDARQGIVHVIGPELGFTLPGTTLVCGDSHTSTHGAFGALAFGIGTSECEIVLATQCLMQRRAATMRVDLSGALGRFITTKDLALGLIATIGAGGGSGFAIEFVGPPIAQFSMAARMTLCNMAIEAGARVGLIAPDDITFAALEGRPMAPKGAMWDRALESWRALAADSGARYDKIVAFGLDALQPHVTWGTSPEDALPVDGRVPDPADEVVPAKRERKTKALAYMGLTPGTALADISIDRAFIGSCTNGRIEDLRMAAEVAAGRRVARGLEAIVVPGSGQVQAQAEREGLDKIFRDAGFEWRAAGCSMCVAMNDDRLEPQQRCASTSNRNFEGRQGHGGRTHLMSPAMAAAAAIAGHIVDVRDLMG